MNIFQTYSVLWMTGLLLLLVAALLFRRKPRLAELGAFGVLVLGLVAVYLIVRPVQTPLMGEAARVRAAIGQGTPVLLEFQSPY